MTRSVYLDYNATAPLRPEARSALLAAAEIGGNASSVHANGRAARARIDEARAEVAALVGASPENVIFTSGGTEANDLALSGIGAAAILTSSIEHDSVLATTPEAGRIAVNSDGLVSLERLVAALDGTSHPSLVSIMAANNETGVIQPIAEIAEIVHSHGGILHCDAVQLAGKVPFDMDSLGIDVLTLSAHKIGGVSGVGALIVAGDRDVAPQLRGGGQERGRRAGTENLPGISAFGAAAVAAVRDLDDGAQLASLRNRLETAVRAEQPDVVIYGRHAERLPNTSCIGLPGVSAEIQVINLDLAGIAVSAGAACSSGKVTPSHVLQAMGASADAAASAIRISTGSATTSADIDHLISAWTEMANRLGATRVAA